MEFSQKKGGGADEVTYLFRGGRGLFKQPKCNNVRKGQAGVKRKVGFKKMFAERASWRRQASVSPSLSFILFVFIAFYFLFLANWRE